MQQELTQCKSDYEKLAREFEKLKTAHEALKKQVERPFVIFDDVFTSQTMALMKTFLDALVDVETAFGGDRPGNESLFESIFEAAQPGKPQSYVMDQYRRQLGLPSLCTLKKVVNRFQQRGTLQSVTDAVGAVKNELKAYLSKRYKDFELSDGVVLESIPGGKNQEWHRDYFLDRNLSREPVTIFVALSNCALDFLHFETRKESRVFLQLGQVLLFRGFTVHRGIAYDSINFRMHFYCVDKVDEVFLKKIPKYSDVLNIKQRDEPSPLFSLFTLDRQ